MKLLRIMFISMMSITQLQARDLGNTVDLTFELIPIEKLLEDNYVEKPKGNIGNKVPVKSKKRTFIKKLSTIKVNKNWNKQFNKTHKTIGLFVYGDENQRNNLDVSNTNIDLYIRKTLEVNLASVFPNKVNVGVSVFKRDFDILAASLLPGTAYGFKGSIGHSTQAYFWEKLSLNSSIYGGFGSGKTNNHSVIEKNGFLYTRGYSVSQTEFGASVAIKFDLLKSISLLAKYQYGYSSVKAQGNESMSTEHWSHWSPRYAIGLGINF